MPMMHMFVGRIYEFDYTNHEGRIENRQVRFESLSVGENTYHPEMQWLLNGYCMNRNARRSFAMKDIDLLSIRETNIAQSWPHSGMTWDQYGKCGGE